MPTVLAFEPDPRQGAALERVVEDRVGATFVRAESKDAALSAIRAAVPDLILLTALISPRDESEIADLIRDTEGAEHTQTLTIPLLDVGAARPARKKKRGLLSALTGEADEPAAPSGCDPAVFADEISNYLHQAEQARAEAALTRERRAKKPRRRKRDAADEPAPEIGDTDTSSYWAWGASPGAHGADATPEPEPEPMVAPQPPPDALETTAATAGSSWDNPWDVSAPSIWKAPAAVESIYLDDHIIPGPDPFLASPAEAVDALLEQPAPTTAADRLAATAEARGQVADPAQPAPAPALALEASAALGTFEPPVAAPAMAETASEADPCVPPEPEIVKARLPTRAESGALLALQADVARLRQQRASTDATLVAAKAAQERAARAALESAERAKREADRRAEELAARAREEARAERRARELAERRAQQEAERRAETERRARQEAERLAREAADRAREEAAAKAREEAAAERKAREAAERLAREEAERRVEAERRAREQAERRAAAERKAREQAERRAREETLRLEREAQERLAHAEAERKAREAAEARAAAERAAREKAEQRAREDAERLAREAERKARQQADERARKAEQAAREQAARLAREVEARARQEAADERRARQQAEQRAEAERAARQALERRTEAERTAREEAERAAEAARAQAQAAARPAPARKPRKAPVERPAPPEPTRRKKEADPRAVQDEWGLYDPQAAGFEALFAKLEAIENGTAVREPAEPPRRTPRPLAMWAFQTEPVGAPPAPPSGRGRDDFRALVSQFSIPLAVASVGYASGARIRKVNVPAVNTRRARSDADPRVVILSRKLLKAARRQTATARG